MNEKYARSSFGKPYLCKKDWPEDCNVQCGSNGIVLPSGSFEKVMSSESIEDVTKNMITPETYVTAFFEAFPKNPNTFIRGEGKTIEEAEEMAYVQFEKISNCQNHEFEKRGYTNGAGFCKHCNLFKTNVFDPDHNCKICNVPTYYSFDKNKEVYCENCKHLMPESDKPDWMIMHEKFMSKHGK